MVWQKRPFFLLVMMQCFCTRLLGSARYVLVAYKESCFVRPAARKNEKHLPGRFCYTTEGGDRTTTGRTLFFCLFGVSKQPYTPPPETLYASMCREGREGRWCRARSRLFPLQGSIPGPGEISPGFKIKKRVGSGTGSVVAQQAPSY